MSARSPNVAAGPPLAASRSAPLPERESLLPPQFDGLTEEQAFALALAMYLQSESKGQNIQGPPIQLTQNQSISFENMPAYPVDFEAASEFTDLVRDGTPEAVYNFSHSMNKKQFALYYAGLSEADKDIYWDKYIDHEATVLARGGRIENVTPRALEKYMNSISNDEFTALLGNNRRLPNSVVLRKGKWVKMSRKNREKLFRQKYVGTLAKAARTRRAAGQVPAPYVPPPPRRLGVPEPAPQPSLDNILLGYTNEEKANFRRHVIENDAAGLAAYLAQYPRQTLVELYGTLNNASKQTFKSKRASGTGAPAAVPVTNEEIAADVLQQYAAGLGNTGEISANALGTRKNVTARYINSLNDPAYNAFKNRLSRNTYLKIQAALPKMQRKDRRNNLTNKLRKDAFLERRRVIEMQAAVKEDEADAEAQLAAAREEEAAARAEQQAAEAELAELQARKEKSETVVQRIQVLIATIDRARHNITAVGQRIAFLTTLTVLGTAVWNAGAAYLQGGILGGAAAAFYTAVATYQAHRASQQYRRMNTMQNDQIGPSRSAIQKLENSMKERKRMMTLNNISKKKIFVDVSLDLSEVLGSYGLVTVGSMYKPASSKHATASFGKHEVKIENGKLFVYINESPTNTIKREIPVPAKKAGVVAPFKKVNDMKVTISHNISLTSGSGLAGVAFGAAASAAMGAGAGGQALPAVPWLTISYEADVHVDNSGKYFFYFLNQPSMEIPLLLLDKTWQ